ncbi:DUF3021 domain-containing protein [Peptostreptococcus porci]|uniref:DUF3021 domain-containing protein n=1 Tax=Peptostreptococcus porci TaxID=2652282 RepID=UPI002A75FCBA|nr:DUF3021 domain-containing protein [Peptostreptococcus porci]MDY2795481.1 DUF3021 domain-containing protein [Peptostreptococcus porci]
MRNSIIKKIFVGFFIGVGISTIISIFISITIGKGIYYPVNPQLISEFGGELRSVIIQCVLSGILGAIWNCLSTVLENENMSLLKKTLIHLFTGYVCTCFVAYILNWTERSILGILSFFVAFIVVYALVWIFEYYLYKKNINKINSKLKNM